MIAAAIILWCVAAYLVAGLIVAVAFVTTGVQRVDHNAVGSSGHFRLMLVPGCTVLWPLIVKKWTASRRAEPRP